MSFKGDMFSAGCSSFPTTGSGSDCPKVAGFYENVSNNNGNLVTSNLPTNFDKYSNFSSGKSPSFSAEYIEMPSSSADQQAAATDKGIKLESNETKVELVAAGDDGQPFTSLSGYDSDRQKWKEKGTTYQYIRLKDSNGKTLREFRYSSDMVLKQKSTSGGVTSWNAVSGKSPFNGVIFGTQGVTVNGPSRLDSNISGAISKMPPAIASFGQLNITADNSISIASDLTLMDTPCDNQGKVQDSTCSKDPSPRNGLVLYATQGDLVISDDAPANVNIYAAMMASKGGLTVEGYNTRKNLGTFKIMGSLVENAAKVKGTGGGATGYIPSYSYDNRFRAGILPAAAPISKVWTVRDADSTDLKLNDLIWQQGSASDF
ncbi:hypothetical protein [uncultured Deinococcus sp.]|uniref:hypothetical protein n=1 Tax=uncultured Deinococcus sp. TaxID=158789 RepID=UPI00258DC8CD|nr:hypothetical protein [uncultured Deinococcus sp.]